MKLRFAIVLLLYAYSFYFTQAQTPYSIKYSLEEGLPTSNVYSVYQDTKGYLWFCTDVGVLQYDGYNFKHYSTDDGLGDNEIFKIFEDSQKRIWFISLNGKLSYYKNNIFYNIKNSEVLNNISHNQMLIDISEAENGDLIIIYKDGKIVEVSSNLRLKSQQNLNKSVFGTCNINNVLHALTLHAFVNVNTKAEMQLPENTIQFNGYRVFKLKQSVLFTSKGDVFQLKNKEITRLISLKNEDIIFISENANQLFIGTRNGLYIKTDTSLRHYFKGQGVSSVCKDNFNGFWITTLDSGIIYTPNFQLQFIDSFNNSNVNTLYKTNTNQLYVGTSSGLFYKNYQDTMFLTYSNIENEIKKIKAIDNELFALGKDSTYIINSQTINRLPIEVKDILPIKDDMLFAYSVVLRMPKNKLLQTNFKNNAVKDRFRVFKNRTNTLIAVNDSVVLGTSAGLYSLKHYKFKKITTPDEVLNSGILDLFYDNKTERLLVATNSKGLTVIENGKLKYSLTKQSGLQSNVCNAISKLKDNVYLVGTNKGISKIIINNNKVDVINLNTELRIKNERIIDIETFNDSLYFLSKNKLYTIALKRINTKQIAPILHIESLKVNDSITTTSKFNYDKNDISINYTGLSYPDFGNIKYQYRWKDNVKWQTTTSRQLNFNSLKPGDYTLNVRALAANNTFSKIQAVTFKITPPFWQTSWFFVLLLALAFFVTMALIRHKIKQIKQKYETEQEHLLIRQERIALEKKTIELEQKAMQLQMNPHFIFNALNTIKGYYSGGDIDEANIYISKFSKLLRKVLENDKDVIALQEELIMLKLYIELMQLRYKNLFTYVIDVSSEIEIEALGVPPLLFQPIVENAIIHGLVPKEKGGKLVLKFKLENNKIVGVVEDDGIGYSYSKAIKAAVKHKSKALQLTKDRIDFVNTETSKANFEINDRIPSGTKVIIRLPIINLWD